MDDLINRQAVINAILHYTIRFPDYTKPFREFTAAIKKDLMGEINAIPLTQQWTPIDKNLPDNGELPDECVDVLISVGDEVYESYRDGNYWFYDETFIPIHHADAWMLMPPAYKGEA